MTPRPGRHGRTGDARPGRGSAGPGPGGRATGGTRPYAGTVSGPADDTYGRDAAGRSAVTRRRRYFALMGLCLLLFVGAWAVVRLYSVPLAIGMCAVAAVIPPVAAVVANRRGPEEPWWDEDGSTGDTDGARDADGGTDGDAR